MDKITNNAQSQLHNTAAYGTFYIKYTISIRGWNSKTKTYLKHSSYRSLVEDCRGLTVANMEGWCLTTP